MTECKTETIQYHALGTREVRGQFDGGDISTDAGGLLLRETEKRTGILKQFAECFRDYRDPRFVEHGIEQLVSQRVYGLCLGYEDLNDHDQLRSDPVLAVMVGETDPKGRTRKQARDRGKALAGKSTLNRLELSTEGAAKHPTKKIGRDEAAIDRLMVDVFLQAHRRAPRQIILLDATDDLIHSGGSLLSRLLQAPLSAALYFGSSAEFVGKTVFHRRLRRPRCSPSLKASLASSAAAPALTLGCVRGVGWCGRWGTGPPAGAPGTGCRRPTEVGTGIFAVEQKNKVLCFNYLCAHRPLDCPQILRRRLYFLWGVRVVFPATTLRHRWCGRIGRGTGTDRGTDSAEVAQSPDRDSGGLGFLPR